MLDAYPVPRRNFMMGRWIKGSLVSELRQPRPSQGLTAVP
jgi:hypothetical protein